ncbi:IS200/IS605 family transposase [Candidatus Kaiserbacteria bacterium]|nr:IS200/IS605 family transposase [Candidatus Kaiserbacteria bacterium]
MSPLIKKSHSANELVYHLVCPVKYRRKIFTSGNEPTLKALALELEKRYELHFLEIGIDKDHVHFLIQTIPALAPSELANTVKGNLSRQFFITHPEVKIFLWGGSLWTDGYYINTVGNANMSIIKNYVKNQGYPEYKQLHQNTLTLF